MADVIRWTHTHCRDRPKEGKVTEFYDRQPSTWAVGRTTCLSLARDVYSLRSVLAAAYKFSDRCAALVDTDGEDRWAVFIIGQDIDQIEKIRGAFINDLADQQLRDLLERQFAELRTLIVAQAFSEGNLLDPD